MNLSYKYTGGTDSAQVAHLTACHYRHEPVITSNKTKGNGDGKRESKMEWIRSCNWPLRLYSGTCRSSQPCLLYDMSDPHCTHYFCQKISMSNCIPSRDSGTIFLRRTIDPLQWALVYFLAWHQHCSIGLSLQWNLGCFPPSFTFILSTLRAFSGCFMWEGAWSKKNSPWESGYLASNMVTALSTCSSNISLLK